MTDLNQHALAIDPTKAPWDALMYETASFVFV